MTIKIKQGQADTLTEVVTNLASLSGYTCKLYIETIDGTVIDTITGSISTLTVTYEISTTNSVSYTIGEHKYETWAFDDSGHKYPLSDGKFIITAPVQNNPS